MWGSLSAQEKEIELKINFKACVHRPRHVIAQATAQASDTQLEHTEQRRGRGAGRRAPPQPTGHTPLVLGYGIPVYRVC